MTDSILHIYFIHHRLCITLKKIFSRQVFLYLPAFPHGTELSMFTNNHHQRVAALDHYLLSFSVMVYLYCSLSHVQKLELVVLLHI